MNELKKAFFRHNEQQVQRQENEIMLGELNEKQRGQCGWT